VASVAAAQRGKETPGGEVTVAAVGDITMGITPSLPPDGGSGFFAHVGPYLRADIVLGNLETTLTGATASQCGGNGGACFDFKAPPSFARLLRKAGFTILNLANNHSYDYLAQGRRDTVQALGRAGLDHTGLPGEITYENAGGARVALIGFAPYEWAQSLLDIPAAVRLVREAGRNADLVIVTMHAGAEGIDHQHVRPGTEMFLGENRGNVVAFSHAVVDAGADLVVGHSPHVLRGMEWYKGRLIAYSLGNFSAWHNFALSGVLGASGILHVTLDDDGSWVRGRLVATRLVDPGVPEPDPAEAAHRLVRDLSKEDFGRRAVRVSPAGELIPPAPRS
jgi:hypothetical protein